MHDYKLKTSLKIRLLACNIMHKTFTFGGIEKTYNMWESSLN